MHFIDPNLGNHAVAALKITQKINYKAISRESHSESTWNSKCTVQRQKDSKLVETISAIFAIESRRVQNMISHMAVKR